MTDKEKRKESCIEMQSQEWQDLMHYHMECNTKIDWWEKEAKSTKEKLKELSGGLDAQGMGFKLSKVMTRGRLDYDAILCQNNIDIDLCQEFRKPDTESWRITKDKEI